MGQWQAAGHGRGRMTRGGAAEHRIHANHWLEPCRLSGLSGLWQKAGGVASAQNSTANVLGNSALEKGEVALPFA